jgi:hypothetical protein
MATFNWPASGGGGVTVYSTLAAFPVTANNGDLAIAADTNILYEWYGSIPGWEPIASNAAYLAALGAVLTMGPFGSTPNANGGVIAATILNLEPADATHPGGISIVAQSFGGAKTFVTSISTPVSLLTGSSTGTISILPQANAGTYNFNLPITAGTSGYLLTSDGGGAGTGMTWTNPASFQPAFSGLTVDGVIYAASASTIASTAVGTIAYPLVSNGLGFAPTFQQLSLTAGVTGNLPLTNGGIYPLGSDGNILTITAGIPGWAAPAIPGSITVTQTSTNASFYPTFISGNTTGSYGLDVGTGLSFNPSTNIMSTTGLNLSGLTASYAVVTDVSNNLISLQYTPTATASTLVSRDANGNTNANNFISNTQTTTTAGGTTTLTAASPFLQIFNGTSNQTIKLPNATTLATGASYEINANQTSGTLSVVDNGSNAIVSLAPGASVQISLLVNGFPNGVWDKHFLAPTGTTWGTSGLSVVGTLTSSSTITSGANGGNVGTLVLNGSSSGAVTIKPQAAAGTFEFDLPITAGTAGQVLTSQGGAGTAMTWSNVAAAFSGLTTDGVIYATSATAVASTAAGTTAYPLVSNGGGGNAPTFQQLSLTAGVTGILPIANGGTNVSSVTISPTATAFAGWDSNKNLSANSFIPGWQSIATAAGTTTLLVGSPFETDFTGTTTQTCVLPTTGIVAGQGFKIVNSSTGVVTVQASGGGTIQAMPSGSVLSVTALVAAPTTAANWNAQMSVNGLIIGTAPTVTKLVNSNSPSAGATATAVTGNYTTPSGVQWISVKAVGAGGGGSGSATSTNAGGTGGTGGQTFFGTSLLTANGGVGGACPSNGNGPPGAGGSASITSSATVYGSSFSGSSAGGEPTTSVASVYFAGSSGGTSPFGGAGAGGSTAALAGGNAAGNTGSGGGGAGTGSAGQGGTGGGSGGFISAIIIPTAGQVFAYQIGGAGGGGAAGAGGAAGGNGGGGYIEITEYYNNYAVSSVLVGVSPTVTKLVNSNSPSAGSTATAVTGNYTTPSGVQWISVKAVGAGGAGAGSGTGSQGSTGNGGNTSFGTSLITANGGSGSGLTSNPGGAGGTVTALGAGAIGTSLAGAPGSSGQFSSSGDENGAPGASTPFGGGGGGGGYSNGPGQAAPASTGAGGGGAGFGSSNGYTGGGGGAGAFVDAIVVPTAGQVFAYQVGGAGGGGAAGAGGAAGGNGGGGYIEITEYYTNLAVGTQAAIPANQVMAGPSSGASAQPTFRALAAADLPAVIGMSYTDSSAGGIGTSLATYTYGTKLYDSNNAYSAGTYTIPLTGKYRISASIATTAVTNSTAQALTIEVTQNGTAVLYDIVYGNGASSIQYATYVTGTLVCTTGDSIVVKVRNDVSTTAYNNPATNVFSIERLGS